MYRCLLFYSKYAIGISKYIQNFGDVVEVSGLNFSAIKNSCL